VPINKGGINKFNKTLKKSILSRKRSIILKRKSPTAVNNI
jgi:hypothetical protein